MFGWFLVFHIVLCLRPEYANQSRAWETFFQSWLAHCYTWAGRDKGWIANLFLSFLFVGDLSPLCCVVRC